MGLSELDEIQGRQEKYDELYFLYGEDYFAQANTVVRRFWKF